MPKYKTKYKLHKEYHPRHRNSLIPHGVSKEEMSVSNILALEFPGVPIYRSNRQILHGKELDIYIPSKHLAIEFDGLKFHSGDSKTSTYHLWKTVECEKQGIQLIHIFSDEWESKRALVIDLLRKTLNKCQILSSQDCILSKLSKTEGHNFIESCDLRGDNNPDNYIGLFYNNELVAALSYTDTEDYIIIHRYTERRLIRVNEGLNKFVDYLDSQYHKNIKTYIDRRLYTGQEFIGANFIKTEATRPNVWYTKDFKSRIQGDNVKLSEAKLQGFSEVYDCGYIVFKKAIE